MRKIAKVGLIALMLIAPFIRADAANVLGNPITAVQSTVAEGSRVFKASPGLLNSFSATSGASAGYVMFFDAITAPADGTVTPKLCYSVAANTTVRDNFGSFSVPFTTGIVSVFSTTGCYTKTVSATAFFSAQVQ